MGFSLGDLKKPLGMETLTHQTTLHIGKAGQNGVDRAIFDGRFECLKREIACHELCPYVHWDHPTDIAGW
jgi:hypothetical protein